MGKCFLLAVLLLLPAGWFTQNKQDKPDKQEKKEVQEPFVIPPEEAKRENPAKADERSIATGKRWYDIECAMCHGADGDGKGPAAESLQVKLLDLRDPAALKERTDGELFYIIKKGKGKMPPEGTRLKDDQYWHLVNYVRSLAKKEPATPKPEKNP